MNMKTRSYKKYATEWQKNDEEEKKKKFIKM